MARAALLALLAVGGLGLYLTTRNNRNKGNLAAMKNHNASYGVLLADMNPGAEAPRGIRNHNPGNIEDTGTPWRGLVGNDGRFAIFETPWYGIRALARVLKTYREKHGLTTITQVIARWAPPHENDTESYTNAVSARLGKHADQPLAMADYPHLVAAIVHHENGVQPYPMSLIEGATDAGFA